jgi:hypothetical protein
MKHVHQNNDTYKYSLQDGRQRFDSCDMHGSSVIVVLPTTSRTHLYFYACVTLALYAVFKLMEAEANA